MAIVLFLCSFLPPLAECEQRLLDAERFQSALHYVLPCPHDAHDEAQEQVEYHQFQVWAHCDAFTAEHRVWWLGECFALMAGRAMR